MSTPVLQLKAIAQIAINAPDIPASTAFYRDILGLKFLFAAGERLAFFDCGGVRLMLDHASEPEFDHPSSILYFPVPDLDAAHAALVAAGVTIERAPQLTARMPDHELWMCFFRDPAHNLLALLTEKR